MVRGGVAPQLLPTLGSRATANKTNRGPLMPRCPLCRSALVTITFGLYPIAICTSCSARWIQDGHQQRTINQVQEPTLFASAH
jgi:hypothetical protein